jgi:dTDP-4-dehydrorhamnose 3,5-epimerase-like enzyme
MTTGRIPVAFVRAVDLVRLPHHFEDNGDLVVMEGMINVPFSIARVFVVRAPTGAIRGQHAHRVCAQFLTCPSGAVEVICDDGEQSVTHLLDHPNIGLLVPPGIWAQQTYRDPHSALTVLCDQPYDAADYIRDYRDFKAYRKSIESTQL